MNTSTSNRIVFFVEPHKLTMSLCMCVPSPAQTTCYDQFIVMSDVTSSLLLTLVHAMLQALCAITSTAGRGD